MTRNKTKIIRVEPKTHQALFRRKYGEADTFDGVIQRLLEETDGVTPEDVTHELKRYEAIEAEG